MVKTFRIVAAAALVLAFLSIWAQTYGWVTGTLLAAFLVTTIASIVAGLSPEARAKSRFAFRDYNQPRHCIECGVEVWRHAKYCGEFGDHCENTEASLAAQHQAKDQDRQ
jgi:hypothetical protein